MSPHDSYQLAVHRRRLDAGLGCPYCPADSEATVLDLTAARARLTGLQLRDQGTAQVWANTSEFWREAALCAIEELAVSGRRFTAEQVRAKVGDPPHPNAMGAALLAMSKRKLIVRTGTTRSPARPERHANQLAEWVGAEGVREELGR